MLLYGFLYYQCVASFVFFALVVVVEVFFDVAFFVVDFLADEEVLTDVTAVVSVVTVLPLPSAAAVEVLAVRSISSV